MLIDDLENSYNRLLELRDNEKILHVIFYYIYRIKELTYEIDDKVLSIMNNDDFTLSDEQKKYVSESLMINDMIKKFAPLILLLDTNKNL